MAKNDNTAKKKQKERCSPVNQGWYIIPFSVHHRKKHEFFDFISKHSERFKEEAKFDEAQFFLYYIKQLAIPPKSETEKQKRTHLIRTYEVNYDEKINFGKIEGVDTSKVSHTRTDMVLFSDYLGFLIIHLEYGSLSLKEIEEFSYEFRRRVYAGRDNITGNLEEYAYYLLGGTDEYVVTFFANGDKYAFMPNGKFELKNNGKVKSNYKRRGNCDLLQLIYASPAALEENGGYHRFRLGRGYNNKFLPGNTYDSSEVDLHASYHDGVEWHGCQQVLTCISTDVTDSFNRGPLPNHVCYNYMFMYLLLLNQRYSMLYLLNRLVNTDAAHTERMDEIEAMLSDFKVYYSFKAVSDELAYQNLYNRMMSILNIDELIQDVQDTSEKIRTQERFVANERRKTRELQREEEKKRERRTNRLLAGIGILAIFSALIDFAQYLDIVFLNEKIPATKWIGFCASLIVISVIFGITVKKAFYSDKNKV